MYSLTNDLQVVLTQGKDTELYPQKSLKAFIGVFLKIYKTINEMIKLVKKKKMKKLHIHLYREFAKKMQTHNLSIDRRGVCVSVNTVA